MYKYLISVFALLIIIGCSEESNNPSVPSKNQDVVLIPAGTFSMGNNGTIYGLDNEKPAHLVTISNSFYMRKYEVTQALWTSVMETNPSYFKGNNLPVEKVLWIEAIEFCNKLSDRDSLERCYTIIKNDTVICDWTKKGWRLPTEAEWEYACKAGMSTDLYSGQLSTEDCSPIDDNLNSIGWYCGNSNEKTHNVGGKKPNKFGLYDMSGNVNEWCWDGYSFYSKSSTTDPKGATVWQEFRVIRGGSWKDYPDFCRSESRHIYNIRENDIGFRIVRSK